MRAGVETNTCFEEKTPRRSIGIGLSYSITYKAVMGCEQGPGFVSGIL